MSPMLFNEVMDGVLDMLPMEIGVDTSKDFRINHLAFVDDLVLLSGSKKGMKMLLKNLAMELAKVGLKINPTKCASLRACLDGKNKKWNILRDPFLQIEETPIATISIGFAYRCLGVLMGAKGTPFPPDKTLTKNLQQIEKAPL